MIINIKVESDEKSLQWIKYAVLRQYSSKYYLCVSIRPAIALRLTLAAHYTVVFSEFHIC